jgi:hypothetical protein
MTLTLRQVVKSAIGICCGVGLGLFCWYVLDYGRGYVLFIGGVGSFIGFALSLPGVSARRVAGATTEMIVGYNLTDGSGESGHQTRTGTNATATESLAKDGANETPDSDKPWKLPRT